MRDYGYKTIDEKMNCPAASYRVSKVPRNEASFGELTRRD